MSTLRALTNELFNEYSPSDLLRSLQFAKQSILDNAETVTQVDKDEMYKLDQITLFVMRCGEVVEGFAPAVESLVDGAQRA